MDPDISRDLTVQLQNISVTVGEAVIQLLPGTIFTFIDSTVPQIWLPEAACKLFEVTLGLIWNDTIGVYTVNETFQQSLDKQNTNFTFTITNPDTTIPHLDIILPYAAFDLSIGFPVVEKSIRYFPIMRAANETQYVLGRTFLQEA